MLENYLCDQLATHSGVFQKDPYAERKDNGPEIAMLEEDSENLLIQQEDRPRTSGRREIVLVMKVASGVVLSLPY